jgi:CopG family nickel-responsive transcriptional regulator
MSVSRFGVSLEEALLKALDEYVTANRFANRSQAIRHLIEKNIVEEKWKCDNVVTGAIVLVYPFHKKEIKAHITDIHHDYQNEILSIQSFHVNDVNCLEVIAVKGPSHKLTELSEMCISIKGVQHGKLVMSKAE